MENRTRLVRKNKNKQNSKQMTKTSQGKVYTPNESNMLGQEEKTKIEPKTLVENVVIQDETNTAPVDLVDGLQATTFSDTDYIETSHQTSTMQGGPQSAVPPIHYQMPQQVQQWPPFPVFYSMPPQIQYQHPILPPQFWPQIQPQPWISPPQYINRYPMPPVWLHPGLVAPQQPPQQQPASVQFVVPDFPPDRKLEIDTRIPSVEESPSLEQEEPFDNVAFNQNVTTSKQEVTNNAKPADPIACQFNGRYASQYQEFLSYFNQTRKALDKNKNTLGKVSEKKEYYFEETEECKNFAKQFLQNYWENKGNLFSTLENHSDKYKALKTNDDIFPSCISFIDATIDGKRCMLIGLSGSVISNHTNKDLIRFIEAYNRQNPQVECILIGNEQRNFRMMIDALEKEKSDSPCAENALFSFLLKAMLEKGSKIYVNGAVNCDFYPYERNVRYGKQKDSVNPSLKPPIYRSGGVDISYQSQKVRRNNFLNIRVPLKPCCTTCEARKESMFEILKAGEKYAAENADKITENRLQTSPVAYSIKTNQSLFKDAAKLPPLDNKTKASLATRSHQKKS